MEAPDANTPLDERKRSFHWTACLLWPGVFLLLYFLSTGPLVLLLKQKRISQTNPILKFYQPLDWVYRNDTLGKPFRMYLHLWVPERYDKFGNEQAHNGLKVTLGAKL